MRFLQSFWRTRWFGLVATLPGSCAGQVLCGFTRCAWLHACHRQRGTWGPRDCHSSLTASIDHTPQWPHPLREDLALIFNPEITWSSPCFLGKTYLIKQKKVYLREPAWGPPTGTMWVLCIWVHLPWPLRELSHLGSVMESDGS